MENQVKAGELTADFVEYFAHQYLHRTKFHMEHHHTSNMKGMIDGDYFLPWWMSAPGRKEKILLEAVKLPFILLKPFFPHFYDTIDRRADEYYKKHAQAHRDPYTIWDSLPNHALHHVFQIGYWGVTNSNIDRLFGTSPEIDEEKLEKIEKRYVERGEKALPIVKAEAERKQKEFEDKCKGIFNKIMDGLDYAAKKRWELERIVRNVRYKLPL